MKHTLMHVRGEDPCGQVAFYYDHDLTGIVSAEYATYPDGSKPFDQHPIKCGSCHHLINISDIEEKTD